MNKSRFTEEQIAFRRRHVLLRREGWAINHKRVHRLYREEGLTMRTKTPRRRKSCRVRQDRRPPATRINENGSPDFMSNELFDGRRIRILTGPAVLAGQRRRRRACSSYSLSSVTGNNRQAVRNTSVASQMGVFSGSTRVAPSSPRLRASHRPSTTSSSRYQQAVPSLVTGSISMRCSICRRNDRCSSSVPLSNNRSN